MIDAQRRRPRMIWELAVVLAGDQRLIGACDLTLGQPHEADLGFIVARDVWGRGYASEIARELVGAAFDQLGVDRVFATCDVESDASARCASAPGCGARLGSTNIGSQEINGGRRFSMPWAPTTGSPHHT